MLKKAGKPRKLDAWLAGPKGPRALFAGRFLPFDERAVFGLSAVRTELDYAIAILGTDNIAGRTKWASLAT